MRLSVRFGHRSERVGHRSAWRRHPSAFVGMLSERLEHPETDAGMPFGLRLPPSVFLEHADVFVGMPDAIGGMRYEPTIDAPRRARALPRARRASLRAASARVRMRNEGLHVPRDAPRVPRDTPCKEILELTDLARVGHRGATCARRSSSLWPACSPRAALLGARVPPTVAQPDSNGGGCFCQALEMLTQNPRPYVDEFRTALVKTTDGTVIFDPAARAAVMKASIARSRRSIATSSPVSKVITVAGACPWAAACPSDGAAAFPPRDPRARPAARHP
jgi:hypothetical protein